MGHCSTSACAIRYRLNYNGLCGRGALCYGFVEAVSCSQQSVASGAVHPCCFNPAQQGPLVKQRSAYCKLPPDDTIENLRASGAEKLKFQKTANTQTLEPQMCCGLHEHRQFC